jgi:tetraacyldisaccharide 4'-kinase
MTILHGSYSLISWTVCWIKNVLVRYGVIKQRKAPLPVISIGNLILGGSEKTPLVMELLSYFEGLGLRPAIVTRGYKGKWEKDGGVLSDGKAFYGGWEEAGDEPYLAAHRFPKAGVFVGKQRYRSCLKAKEMGFQVALLDDGFQHVKLARNLDIVLHDPQARGPLREGLSSLRRADILLLKKDRGKATFRKIRHKFPALPVFEYAVVSRGLHLLETNERFPADILKGKNILAFCGIARPERFFALLEECGIQARTRMVFPDHFSYPARALDKIVSACASLKPDAIVTTEKDALKILGRTRPLAAVPVYVLDIGLDLPPAFFERVRDILAALVAPPGQ